MDSHYTDWLSLTLRWVHMITGVAWIGASFYFNWLENNLERRSPREGLAGDLWAIHGGGIYHLEKYKLAPPRMPEHLHWFKWEAYFTWITGMLLLAVVFYFNASAQLLLPGSSMSSLAGVGLGLGSLVVGWFVYDILCDSPLGRKPTLLALAIAGLITVSAWGFSQVFGGRGAYMHVGAVIGTIMVGNVFFVIMPAQRALVSAISEGRPPDPLLPARGLLRSRHNNYLTLPVLFIMISNHFPSTYGSRYGWAILSGMSAVSVLVRHYFNTRQQSQAFAWALPVAALAMISFAYVTSPARSGGGVASGPVSFSTVQAIVGARCITCHSAVPTYAGFAAPPAGVMFDTPELIKQNAPRMRAQAVAAQIMPLGNLTKMTLEERMLLGAWIDQGAVITPIRGGL